MADFTETVKTDVITALKDFYDGDVKISLWREDPSIDPATEHASVRRIKLQENTAGDFLTVTAQQLQDLRDALTTAGYEGRIELVNTSDEVTHVLTL